MVRFNFAPRSWLAVEQLFPGFYLEVLNVMFSRCPGISVIFIINHLLTKGNSLYLLVHRQAQNLTFP